MNKKLIAQSFGKASNTYEKDAPVQKWTAGFLAELIQGLHLEQPADCLEIGCGTGFLTQEMMTLFPQANWLITDLSADMLDSCRARIGDGVSYQVMDGEHPALEKKFDLIVSSLAFQWFLDLENALKRLSGLLKPDGRLIFTTLGQETFQQWRDNLNQQGMAVGLHDYPLLEDMQKIAIKGYQVSFARQKRLQPYENGLAFLRALKAIGAQAPQSGYQPLLPGQMRKVIKALEENGSCAMTYDILVGTITKEA
ncbi:MAG: methyltransferase domain-containing protein [Terasakiella sp.]|uniref:methyltransferase domain-containing protein n=1 Tax=unclassified Terasakiella TaxID=2614952 RepID=UPI003AFF6C76